MNKRHARQFTLAGLLALVLVISVMMAGVRCLGPIPILTFIETIPYGLLAVASVVFFRSSRPGVPPWILVTTGNCLFALAIFSAMVRVLQWEEIMTIAQCTAYYGWAGPVGFAMKVAFGVSLLWMAKRMRSEATT